MSKITFFDSLKSYLVDSRVPLPKLDVLLSILIWLILVLIPLVPAVGNQGFEQIKVLLFLGLMTLIAGLLIGVSFQNPSHFRIKNTRLHLSLLGFILALVITSAIGMDFSSSLLGDPPYYQGIIVYLYCYLLFLIITTIPIKLNAIYGSWIISSVIVSLVAITQWLMIHLLGWNLPTYSGRVVSTFGQPSLFSGFILFTIPVILYLLKKASSNKKKLVGLILAIDTFGIIVSESRGALMLVGLLLFLWIWQSFKNRLLKSLIVLTILIVGISGVFSTLQGDGIINQEIIKPLTGQRVGEEGQERRVYIWVFVIDLIGKKPFFGYGLDNLSEVFPTALAEQNPKPPFYFTVKDLTVDRAHNYLLDLLVSGGIVTLVTWLIFFLLLVFHTRLKWERGFLIIFFLYIQLQILSIVQLVFFFTIAGLINRYYKNINTKINSL